MSSDVDAIAAVIAAEGPDWNGPDAPDTYRDAARAVVEHLGLRLLPPGGLVTVTQIGQRLGVSRQMAGKLVRRLDLFPWSMTVGRVTLYRAVDMERAATVERRPGRRPKGES